MYILGMHKCKWHSDYKAKERQQMVTAQNTKSRTKQDVFVKASHRYNNVLEYLEETVNVFPDRTAFADAREALSFIQLYNAARSTGSCLCREGAYDEPVIVFMEKIPHAVAAFLGVVYSGCFYVPVDEEMTANRIQLILNDTGARFILYDEYTKDMLSELDFTGTLISYESALSISADEEKLAKARRRSQDTDAVYIMYTSGSSGVPKGVVGHHRGIIDYIESLSMVLGFDENTVFGNQAPLYMDACMKEIWPTLKFGALTYLIPKKYFMQPVKLIEYLNEKKINTICWVASAMAMVSMLGTFEEAVPEHLSLVTFVGEVLPVKQFNLWKKALPNAVFYNLYGPTEATGVSCYHRADRFYSDDECIPIGRPFPNTRILLIGEDGKEVPSGQTGEIYIRGTCVAHGYYNKPEKTNEAFVQNPLHDRYPDRVYKTGDLGRLDEDGNLVFVSRRDYQVKHMGHRIELGEIEANAGSLEGIKECCCVFIKESGKLLLYYSGNMEKKEAAEKLKKRLPGYMVPNAFFCLEKLPHLLNGKLDRKGMEEMYKNKNKKRSL